MNGSTDVRTYDCDLARDVLKALHHFGVAVFVLGSKKMATNVARTVFGTWSLPSCWFPLVNLSDVSDLVVQIMGSNSSSDIVAARGKFFVINLTTARVSFPDVFEWQEIEYQSQVYSKGRSFLGGTVVFLHPRLTLDRGSKASTSEVLTEPGHMATALLSLKRLRGSADFEDAFHFTPVSQRVELSHVANSLTNGSAILVTGAGFSLPESLRVWELGGSEASPARWKLMVSSSGPGMHVVLSSIVCAAAQRISFDPSALGIASLDSLIGIVSGGQSVAFVSELRRFFPFVHDLVLLLNDIRKKGGISISNLPTLCSSRRGAFNRLFASMSLVQERQAFSRRYSALVYGREPRGGDDTTDSPESWLSFAMDLLSLEAWVYEELRLFTWQQSMGTPVAHVLAACYDWRAIITTNFDLFHESGSRQAGSDSSRPADIVARGTAFDPDAPSGAVELDSRLFKLYGSVDSPYRFAWTPVQFLQDIERYGSAIKGLVKPPSLRSGSPAIVVCGHSLEDMHLLTLLSTLAERLEGDIGSVCRVFWVGIEPNDLHSLFHEVQFRSSICEVTVSSTCVLVGSVLEPQVCEITTPNSCGYHASGATVPDVAGEGDLADLHSIRGMKRTLLGAKGLLATERRGRYVEVTATGFMHDLLLRVHGQMF